jgi:hypothetical protein
MKVKFTLEQALRAQTCSVGTDLLFLKLDTRRKSVARANAQDALFSEKDSGTPCSGGWVGPRTDLDAFGDKKIFAHARDLIPNFPSRSKSQYRLRQPGPTVLNNALNKYHRIKCEE